MNTLEATNIDTLLHVFVIDDDEAICKMVKIMLNKLGYSVHVYGNALAFLKAIPDVSLSIIITDMKMPLMSGIELQAELDRQGRNIPIIFMSGVASVGQSITAMKKGALDFLIKPFKRGDLMVSVKSAFKLVEKNNRNSLRKIALEVALKTLTPREKVVFDLLIMGYNNVQIMKTLSISLPTTKQYKSAVMRKLKVSTLAELIEMQINYE
jgi:two-component system response regulator FixJ